MNVLRKDLFKLTAQMEQAAAPAGPWGLDIHLMPPTGWLNDPNGLCYAQGYYHVFYQYAPFDPEGGVKFWGHCRSRDLLRWERCPVMLCPDQPFDLHGTYSGSAVEGEDGLYFYYTGSVKYDGDYDYILAGRENNTVMAYSLDGVHLGWKRQLLGPADYPAGLSCHVRDPKVWRQDGQYYMVLGARTADNLGICLVYASPDGLDWTHINTLRTPYPFGYMWECPDLFQLDGQWFLVVSPQGVERTGPGFENQYACGYFPLSGDFRGACELGAFTTLDYGFDFYAPQTFFDGHRRLLVGWLGMPDAPYTNPTAAWGWQHCLTQVRELSVRGGKLQMSPAAELKGLRGNPQRLCGNGAIPLPRAADIEAVCDGPGLLELAGAELRWEEGALQLRLRQGGWGRTVRTAPVQQVRTLRILADTSALEIFVNGGQAVLSTRWYPEGERTLTLRGRGQLSLYPLQPLEIDCYQQTL